MKKRNTLWICLLLLMACAEKEQTPVALPSSVPETQYLAPIHPTFSIERLRVHANNARAYCDRKKLNNSICLLIDMSIHSGHERFFVWDFKQNQVLLKGLVSHGCCNQPWGTDRTKDNPSFSNIPDSHCSSLGKYKVGNRGVSQWGILVNYQLHGLESSNSNANSRDIVLHSWDDVPENPIFPEGTPEGWGCPALSNNNMRVVDRLLKKQSTPVLLWIYK